MVASCSAEKLTCATHPANSATRARRGPTAGYVRPSFEKKNLRSIGGRSFSLSASPSKRQNSGRADERLQSGALVKVKKRAPVRAMRLGIREQAAKNEIARHAREKWPLVVLLDLRARRFHQLAVFHAGGARRLARAAIQALIDVLDEGIAQRQSALVDQNNLANSSARRIGFQAPQFVGGAMIQAQAAVNAVRVVFVRGNVRAGKSALRFERQFLRRWLRWFGHGFRFRPRNVPAPGHFADRTNVSRGASIQNPGAAGPTRLPELFLIPPDTIPAWPRLAFRAGRRHGTLPRWLSGQSRDVAEFSCGGRNAAYRIPDGTRERNEVEFVLRCATR